MFVVKSWKGPKNFGGPVPMVVADRPSFIFNGYPSLDAFSVSISAPILI